MSHRRWRITHITQTPQKLRPRRLIPLTAATNLRPYAEGESHFKDVELAFQEADFAPPAPPVLPSLAAGREHALAYLLALNGLRISEALGADIEHLAVERGHRTLTITRKSGIEPRYKEPEGVGQSTGHASASGTYR